jgi:hypothetical protein
VRVGGGRWWFSSSDLPRRPRSGPSPALGYACRSSLWERAAFRFENILRPRSLLEVMVLPANWPAIGIEKHAQVVVVLSATLSAITFAAAIRAGHTEILFGSDWLLITLALLLPLFGHRSDYYLTIRSIGAVVVVARGISQGWQNGWGGVC